jgi:hypothetical protein
MGAPNRSVRSPWTQAALDMLLDGPRPVEEVVQAAMLLVPEEQALAVDEQRRSSPSARNRRSKDPLATRRNGTWAAGKVIKILRKGEIEREALIARLERDVSPARALRARRHRVGLRWEKDRPITGERLGQKPVSEEDEIRTGKRHLAGGVLTSMARRGSIEFFDRDGQRWVRLGPREGDPDRFARAKTREERIVIGRRTVAWRSVRAFVDRGVLGVVSIDGVDHYVLTEKGRDYV